MSASTSLVLFIELYYAVTTLFDVSPFNGAKYFTRKERLAEWSQNAVVFALPLLKFIVPAAWPAGVIAYGILLIGEYVAWWHGYFFTPWRLNRQCYDRAYRHTILVLSRDRDRFQPNLEHILLHAMTLIIFVVLWMERPLSP